ncbi:hypothetical protein Bca52824_069797 [Brassica carinata]|uniref:Mitochondrial fission protein ELM1 n=1 Tax=Brassica carinata TaxID=52824 RepID=A0A8X7Q493_BRACI|nr:hypothetical protein Bca52824_069797 [Brassica carinata]
MRPKPSPELAVTGPSENPQGGLSGVVKRAIVIGNGCAGAENQCIGLIRSLGLFDRHLYYSVARPRGGIYRWLHWLPISLYKKLGHFISCICSGFSIKANESGSRRSGIKDVFEVADAKQIAAMARRTFDKSGPLLVVASGRDTISVASSIRRLAMDYVFVVQVQHPRSRLGRFDLVITPRHDYFSLTPEGKKQTPFFLRPWVTPREPPGRNFLTTGALHNVDSSTLRKAALEWKEEFASLSKPLVVVNIEDLQQLCGMLQSILWSCGSLRISFSRRTRRRELISNPKVYIWDGKEPNPHLGHLALADAFIITADSISMLSEACTTGKPVYVVGAEWCTWKFSEFQKTLRERGAVRPLTGKENMVEKWSYTPLNDNAEAAKRVIQDLSERGWKIEA